MTQEAQSIEIEGASEHNLKSVSVSINRQAITTITGVSGSGKSSLAFDTVLAECHRRFFYTLSHYSRQFLDIGTRPKVKVISGLSPAIGLAQNETQMSRRASIGTQSDISEILGVALARFGLQSCPKHGRPTGGLSLEQISALVVERFAEKTVALSSPVVRDKKGNFATVLRKYAEKGFRQIFVDGSLLALDPIPELIKEEKHTIDLIIDWVKIKPENRDGRFLRSLTLALETSEGYVTIYEANAKQELLPDSKQLFSSHSGCSSCGYSWPKLDSRHFSRNSLGRCKVCAGYGTEQYDPELQKEGEDPLVDHGVDLARPCSACNGSGFDSDLKAIQLNGLSIDQLHCLTMNELLAFFASLRKTTSHPAAAHIYQQIEEALRRFCAIGVGYLSLGRRMLTLSSGEPQRIRLGSILAESLRGVIYVLDEPSQGLHHRELEQLYAALLRLKERGNTVIIVDHDHYLMQKSDWIIDLGPGGGEHGGQVMAKFKPEQAKEFAKLSVTAAALTLVSEESSIRHQELPNRFIEIVSPRLHNLKFTGSIKIPLERLTVVTGVSGAGKSSLIMGVLWRNLAARFAGREKKKASPSPSWLFCDQLLGWECLEQIHVIDRKPLAKSSISTPATYLDVFTDLRDLYATLPEAQVAGLAARHFSLFHEGGRCESCKGRGYISISMKFLADAKEPCEACQGMRYDSRVNEIRFQGVNLSGVLAMSIEQARAHFQHHKKIVRKLQPAIDMGLGYLKMGQPSASLSGGEAQRLKLAPFLAKSLKAQSIVILDEPTTGLHRVDVDRLLLQLEKLVQRGLTVVVMEHHEIIVQAACWQLELGPGAGHEGGDLLYQGPARGNIPT